MGRSVAGSVPVEDLVSYRLQGLTYEQISERVGFSPSTLAEYGTRVLPDELQGRLSHEVRRRAPAPVEARRCTRCTIIEADDNPVDESGLCLWCRIESLGIAVREVAEWGLLHLSYSDGGQALMDLLRTD